MIAPPPPAVAPPVPVAHVAARGRPTVVSVHVRPPAAHAGQRLMINFRVAGLHRRATAQVRIQRPLFGKPGRSCTGGSLRPSGSAKRCIRSWQTIKTISRSAATGANAVSFFGEVGGHNLARGDYRVSVTWSVSAPRTAPFRII